MSKDSTKVDQHKPDLHVDPNIDQTDRAKPISELRRFLGTVATVLMTVTLFITPAIIAAIILQVWLLLSGNSQDQAKLFLDSTTGQFTFMAVVELLSLCLLWIYMKLTYDTRRSICLVWPKGNVVWMFAKAAGAYYGLLIVVGVLLPLLTSIDIDQKQEIGFDSSAQGGQLVLVFFGLVVLPPLAEEIIFRGFLYTRFRKYFSVIGAALLVSLLFSIGHLQLGSGNAPLWAAAIDTFILSMILVYMREKTGSILPGIALHALKNGIAFSVLFL